MARTERHSEDSPISQPPEIDMSDLDENLDNRRQEIIRADPEMLKERAKLDYVEQLAFNEELVGIYLYRGREEFSPDAVSVWVQGRQVSIPVEKEVLVRRKYLEVLIRAQPQSVKTVVIKPPEGSDSSQVQNKLVPSRSSAYAFTVTLDKNPRGQAWLEGVRREG